MRKLSIYSILSFILYCLMQPLYAADLWDVYQEALKNDATFKQALAERNAAYEQVPQSRAVLLPQVNFTEEGTLSNYKYTGNMVNPLQPVGEDTQEIRTLGFNLSLTQKIFNMADWAALGQAKYSVRAAVATYNAAAQDLMTRTSQAYFDVLQAEDVLRFTKALKRALYEEYQRARESFKVGVKTITDVYNAKAAYDGSVAQEVTDANTLANKREDLRVITGILYMDLAPLKKKIPLIDPNPTNIDQWVDTGIQQSWSLKAARFNSLAANKAIKSASAGHLPTLDFSANYSNDYEHYEYAGGYRSRGPSGKLDFTLPIFSGGNVTSQTRQKVAEFENAKSQEEQSARLVVNTTRKSYLGVLSGISNVKANKQVIISNISSLEGMKEGYKVGTRTMVDVLDAEQALYGSQKDYAVARYSYIMSGIQLKQAAGILDENDLRAINTWLKTNASQYGIRKTVLTPHPVVQSKTKPTVLLQVAAYYRKSDAERLMHRVYQLTHMPTHISSKQINGQKLYCVQIGPVENNKIKQVSQILQGHGFSKPWVIKG